MSRLDESIEQLYLAFAKVRRPKTIDGCPCCTSPATFAKLISAPSVRTIPPTHLERYAFSAFKTVGSAADYVYFLPRILHISAQDDGSWLPSQEIIGRAIRSAKPENWRPIQRQAVDDFFSAIIHECLAPDRRRMIDSWMCANAKSGFPVRPRLSAIQKHKEAFLDYFQENAETLPRRRLANSSWELPCDGHDQIVAWFYSKPARTILENEYGYVLPMPADNGPNPDQDSPGE